MQEFRRLRDEYVVLVHMGLLSAVETTFHTPPGLAVPGPAPTDIQVTSASPLEPLRGPPVSLGRGSHQQVAMPEQRLRGRIPPAELSKDLCRVHATAEREHGVSEAPPRVRDRLLVLQTHLLEC